MQSESADENLIPEQRKGSAEEGPFFVDNSGRHAWLPTPGPLIDRFWDVAAKRRPKLLP